MINYLENGFFKNKNPIQSYLINGSTHVSNVFLDMNWDDVDILNYSWQQKESPVLFESLLDHLSSDCKTVLNTFGTSLSSLFTCVQSIDIPLDDMNVSLVNHNMSITVLENSFKEYYYGLIKIKETCCAILFYKSTQTNEIDSWKLELTRLLNVQEEDILDFDLGLQEKSLYVLYRSSNFYNFCKFL